MAVPKAVTKGGDIARAARTLPEAAPPEPGDERPQIRGGLGHLGGGSGGLGGGPGAFPAQILPQILPQIR